jgi:hypothetical protein
MTGKVPTLISRELVYASNVYSTVTSFDKTER